MFGRAVAVWLLIVAAETAHGVARTILLQPWLGDFRARQVAVLTGSAIILAIAFATIEWIGARSSSQLRSVGLLWVGLMAAFEVALGRFVFGYSWSRIGSDYNLAEGGLLALGMLFLALAPTLAAKLRGG